MYSGVGSKDLESNALLHSLLISPSGLIKDHHKRQSTFVINQRTSKRIKKRIATLIEAHGPDLSEDKEAKYKINRLQRQLRYRTRLDEFRRVLYSFKGINNKWKDELDGGSLLHAACRWGHLEMAIDLLNNKWHINSRNNMGETPLILACREGHVRLVKLLIKGKGGWRGGRAKMLMKDKCGFGCLGYATKCSQREGLKKQKGCLIIVEMLEEEWKRRRIVKFNVKQRLINKINDMDENEDLLEEEEVEESDSDPESSCYEDYNEGEEEDV